MTGTVDDSVAKRTRPRRSRRRLALVAGLLVVASACVAVGLGLRTEGDGLQPIPVPEGEPAGDVDSASIETRLLSDSAVRWVGTFDGEPWDDTWGFNWGGEGTAVVAEVPGVARYGRVLDVAFNPEDLDDRGAAGARIAMNRLAPSR